MLAGNSGRVAYVELERCGAGDDALPPQGPDPRLRLIVIHTTMDGTRSALRAVAALADGLGAVVGVLVAQVVPFHVPLDRPPVSLDFLRRRLCGLASEAGLQVAEVRIQICLCRDRIRALHQSLHSRSLIFIGAQGRWKSRHERKLAKVLSREGHFVILLDTREQCIFPLQRIGADGDPALPHGLSVEL
jgi:hypothetical protein